ncbi:L-lactate dehydrogenase [Candidatus Dependentiae bacterium]|nr:L-lactate dehydrogenase [Candidatus Dependentiae bacterium]
MRHIRIAIIGTGAVGSTIAYTLVLKNSATEIVLIDTDTERCQGEVMDLVDVMGFSRTTKIYQGTYADAKKADIIIISAGKPQKIGESRSALLEANKAIMKSILSELRGLNVEALLMVVTNPLDSLTYYVQQWCELPRAQVFGTGTFLDSQRLKHLISSFAGVAVQSVEAFVLGEHGDSQIVAWSATRIAGGPVENHGITVEMKQELARVVKAEAYEIIKTKGATFYGIAACVAQLCDMIIYDSKQVVPVSWYHERYNVCMSLPVIVGKSGVEKVLPYSLSDEEVQGLELSAALLRKRLL